LLQHAVIHRDIKPDNLIIRNIRLDDQAILVGGLDHLKWSALREKWHLTLVDFGFARALGPTDLEADASSKTLIGASHSQTDNNDGNKVVRRLNPQESIDDAVKESNMRLSRNKLLKDHYSKSRRVVRCLSAVGNRTYAAPEVKDNVRKSETIDPSRNGKISSTLIPFVSDYGMVADAFSVGSTARFVLTGVPPQENLNEFMANHNSLFNKTSRWIGRKFIKRRNNSKPVKQYRPSEYVPVEATRLIKGMTQLNASTRMTVRDARLCPYIDEVVGEKTTFRKDTIFLKCSQK
jgi:serine/threonine protein kinase